jgi:hypothetical protein
LPRYELRFIGNRDLTEADLPGNDADWEQWEGLASFAATFNGYEHWGSDEKFFDVALSAMSRPFNELTLTELRTALFYLYRALHHDDMYVTPDDTARGRALIVEIRDRVRRGATD